MSYEEIVARAKTTKEFRDFVNNPLAIVPANITAAIVGLVSDGTITRASGRILMDFYVARFRFLYGLPITPEEMRLLEEWTKPSNNGTIANAQHRL